MKGQLTGMRGVYLVAAELSRLGYIASPTSRSARGADILVTDQACNRAFSVQVKTNATYANFWIVGERIPISESHLYVFVNAQPKKTTKPEFFIVPGKVVQKCTVHTKHPRSEFWCLFRKDVLLFHDKWVGAFGDPHAELAENQSSETQPV